MSFTKSVISIIIMISIVFSFTAGVVPAYAVDLLDPEYSDDATDLFIEHMSLVINDDECCDDELVDTGYSVEAIDGHFYTVAIESSMQVFDAATIYTDYDDIEQFVARLYQLVLGRTADPEGLRNWSEILKSRRSTGASVAYEFFFCTEFLTRRVSNDQYIDMLYRALLGRNPDTVGRTDWVDALNDGWPRENIFASFVNSIEFDIICNRAGIDRGTYTPATSGATNRVFVARLYRTILQRPPDQRGLDDWTHALDSGVVTGASIAYEFVFSPEMAFRNLNDERFIEVLYDSMLSRRADAHGKADWVNVLRSGISRYGVFVGFVNSVEFGLICNAHGIIRGTPPPPKDLMSNNTNVAKIWNLIVSAHFRGISDRPEHIAGIIGNLQSEAGTSLCPFQIQVSNQRGLGLMQWTNPTATGGGRRTELETYMWRNGVTPEEFYTEMNKHLDRYCNPSNLAHRHPQELFDRVTRIQINFMFHELANTWERQYLGFIDFPANRAGISGSRAYAELFCALVLRPGDGGLENIILDPGVLNAMQASPWPARNSFSALATRRNRAENVFREFLAYSR